MDNLEIEKELKKLNDEKLDRVPMETINTAALEAIDISSETDAVQEAIRVIIEISEKLKGR